MLIVVGITAFLTAALTLFSGFGLGSLLLPAFAVFFPLPVAVAATAVVHLLNNLFKAAMLGRHAQWRVVLAFGIPGAVAAFFGAWALRGLTGHAPLATWQLFERECAVTPDGLAIGGLILAFALFELHPTARKVGFAPRWLPLGGVLSGFLGGLSGHQGALRSAFLLRLSLPKEAYIGTGVMCAVIIDLVRLTEYARGGLAPLTDAWDAVAVGTASAFVGSYLGRKLLRKVTMRAIHLLVGWLLVALGASIAAGLV